MKTIIDKIELDRTLLLVKINNPFDINRNKIRMIRVVDIKNNWVKYIELDKPSIYNYDYNNSYNEYGFRHCKVEDIEFAFDFDLVPYNAKLKLRNGEIFQYVYKMKNVIDKPYIVANENTYLLYNKDGKTSTNEYDIISIMVSMP
jgi:hypothetical protein